MFVCVGSLLLPTDFLDAARGGHPLLGAGRLIAGLVVAHGLYRMPRLQQLWLLLLSRFSRVQHCVTP